MRQPPPPPQSTFLPLHPVSTPPDPPHLSPSPSAPPLPLSEAHLPILRSLSFQTLPPVCTEAACSAKVVVQWASHSQAPTPCCGPSLLPAWLPVPPTCLSTTQPLVHPCPLPSASPALFLGFQSLQRHRPPQCPLHNPKQRAASPRQPEPQPPPVTQVRSPFPAHSTPTHLLIPQPPPPGSPS